MRNQSEDFVRKWFKWYYTNMIDEITPPRDLESREFGFLIFKGKMMVRHKQFTNLKTLKQFIIDLIPADAYHSAAYYKRPDVEMNKKDLIKADLVFDIDADHLNIPCRRRHDRWICIDCGKAEKGIAPESCSKCNGRIHEESWICEECLNAAKEEVIKLVNFLEDDFGLSYDELKVNFSGHRGYHIHVFNEKIVQLGREERKEIVDYLTGEGLDYYQLESNLKGDISNTTNWIKRIKRELVLTTKQEQRRRISRKSIDKSIDQIAAKIDTVVTTDVHRLIRLIGTLNSKTGMKVVNVPVSFLDSFDPFKDALAFRGNPIKVFINEAPHFRWESEEYGPYTKMEKELPLGAALLLICKERATSIA